MGIAATISAPLERTADTQASHVGVGHAATQPQRTTRAVPAIFLNERVSDRGRVVGRAYKGSDELRQHIECTALTSWHVHCYPFFEVPM
jgi:hypothetical protein